MNVKYFVGFVCVFVKIKKKRDKFLVFWFKVFLCDVIENILVIVWISINSIMFI